MLVILGICSSSFGDIILLYNLSASGSGIDVNNNDSPLKVPLKAYFVMRVNDAATAILDANLILYGKDVNTPKPQKVYVELNMSDSNGFLSDLTIQHDGDYRVIDFNAIEGPFNFEGLMLGKLVPVGRTQTMVVTKAKGVILVRSGILLDADQKLTGTGTLSASLDLKNTIFILEESWNQTEVVETGKTINGKHYNGIKGILEAKRYHRFSPAD